MIGEQSLIHTSVTGETLDPNLHQFTQESTRKRSYRILSMLLNQDMPDGYTLHHPVYVTKEENTHQNDLSKRKIAEIDNESLNLIEKMDTDMKQHYFQYFQQHVIKKKKAEHIAFYLELLKASDENLPQIDVDPDDL